MGLYLWVSLLLPMLSVKSGGNPHSRDLILQLVERLGTSDSTLTSCDLLIVSSTEFLAAPSCLY